MRIVCKRNTIEIIWVSYNEVVMITESCTWEGGLWFFCSRDCFNILAFTYVSIEVSHRAIICIIRIHEIWVFRYRRNRFLCDWCCRFLSKWSRLYIFALSYMSIKICHGSPSRIVWLCLNLLILLWNLLLISLI